MPDKQPQQPGPLDLLFMLVDSCMHRLSPSAWKVVCYVAVQHLRVHSEWLERILNPASYALGQDFAEIGIIDSSGESGERPYRSVLEAPTIPGERTCRFPVISLKNFAEGMRLKRRWRDYGTGLSKNSVIGAVHEALQSGILVRQHVKSSAGRDLPNLYAIDWDRVQEYDWQRRRDRKKVPTISTRRSRRTEEE